MLALLTTNPLSLLTTNPLSVLKGAAVIAVVVFLGYAYWSYNSLSSKYETLLSERASLIESIESKDDAISLLQRDAAIFKEMNARLSKEMSSIDSIVLELKKRADRINVPKTLRDKTNDEATGVINDLHNEMLKQFEAATLPPTANE